MQKRNQKNGKAKFGKTNFETRNWKWRFVKQNSKNKIPKRKFEK